MRRRFRRSTGTFTGPQRRAETDPAQSTKSHRQDIHPALFLRLPPREFPVCSIDTRGGWQFLWDYFGGWNYGNGVVFKITPAGVLTDLYIFDFTHGGAPFSPLVQGSDGNFYGTTSGGGSLDGGVAFKL